MSSIVRYSFVVLHYNENSLFDTIECIEAIIQIMRDNIVRIIVVENGSADSSADKLNRKYHDCDSVDLVFSEKNLGFGNGNNLGCRYAIEKYSPEFLIVINNDTVIMQSSFLQVINDIYREEKFDLLGPCIMDKYHEPQNPFVKPMVDLSVVEKKIEQTSKILTSLKDAGFIRQTVNSVLLRLKSLFESVKFLRMLFIKEKRVLKRYSQKRMRGCALHGSALIFSKKYYNKYKNVFYEKTFMFVEEDILFQRVLRDNLISVYCPELMIYHKEDSSTNSLVGKQLQKKIFSLSNRLDSLHVLLKIIREGKES